VEEQCSENGLPEREDIIFDVTAISQVKSSHTVLLYLYYLLLLLLLLLHISVHI